jgi:hypothetical protein
MKLYRIRLGPYPTRILVLALILLLTNTLTGLALSPHVISPGNTAALKGAENFAAAAAPGNWSGSTNLGYPVSFTVSPSGTQWDAFKLTTSYVNGSCSVKLTTTVSGLGTITNNHFSYTGVTFSFSGDFTSTTTATGTYAYTNRSSSCGTFSQTGTWSATIQSILSISGDVGVGGATLSYTDGTLKTVTSQGDGSYSLSVSSNWSGTVTPTHPCYSFNPLNRPYSNVTSNQTVQNYTPTFNNAPVCAVTVGVFRPGSGLLYLKNSNTTGFADVAINYGLGGDYPVVGDWDGDGTATIGVYRNGYFYLRNSNTIGFAEIVFPFGNPGDQPVAGDWDNDGVDTIGVYRPSSATFYLRNSNSEGNPDLSFVLGNPGDVGIAGDWNNNGFDTTGVFRPSSGIIFLKNTNSTGIADIELNYGLPGDRPVMGDWDSDGIDTIGVYRDGTFYLRNSNTNGFAEIVFGLGNPGDMPIAGNWDGLP